jgi:hypothetical protein
MRKQFVLDWGGFTTRESCALRHDGGPVMQKLFGSSASGGGVTLTAPVTV